MIAMATAQPYRRHTDRMANPDRIVHLAVV
jgi:hypothetical protein